MKPSITKGILIGATLLTAPFALPQAASSTSCTFGTLASFTAPCTFGANDEFTFTLGAVTGTGSGRTLDFSNLNTIDFAKTFAAGSSGSFQFTIAATSPEFFTSASLVDITGSMVGAGRGIFLTQPDVVNLTSINLSAPFSFPFTFANNGVMQGTFNYGPTSGGASLTFTTDVPLPLPIVGAGLAFGFTRKLRNRAKLAS